MAIAVSSQKRYGHRSFIAETLWPLQFHRRNVMAIAVSSQKRPNVLVIAISSDHCSFIKETLWPNMLLLDVSIYEFMDSISSIQFTKNSCHGIVMVSIEAGAGPWQHQLKLTQGHDSINWSWRRAMTFVMVFLKMLWFWGIVMVFVMVCYGFANLKANVRVCKSQTRCVNLKTRVCKSQNQGGQISNLGCANRKTRVRKSQSSGALISKCNDFWVRKSQM